MPTIKKIKMTGYCDHHDIAVKDNGVFTVKKHRVTDIYGTWKATEAYEIELRMSDKEVQFLLNRKPSYRDFVSTEDTVKYLRDIGLLPKERLYLFNGDWHYNWINPDGFLPTTPPYLRTGIAKLIVFVHSDFVKLNPTKKEQAIIDNLETRKKMQNLNSIVVADNIVKVLKDNNYEVELHKSNQWREHDAFFFHDKKAFNALVKDALEYYLNNIVLKELGCKITVPKQKSTHGYKYDDVLCYVGDITLDEGEQNGLEKGNKA